MAAMLTHMVSTELRRLFNIQTQQEKGTSKKVYLLNNSNSIQSLIHLNWIFNFLFKVAVLLCRYLQDACSCNDLRWSKAFQCNERMKLCC